MPNTDTDNGWANRPTWNVNVWLSNDESLYWTALDVVRGYKEHTTNWSAKGAGQALRELVFANRDERGGFGDLKRTELSKVNWTELGAAWLEDIIHG
jgi:hypothetical protein